MFVPNACVVMIGLLVVISLSGLHSWMFRVRLVIVRGGCMNLMSFVWVLVRYLTYVLVVFCVMVAV